MNNRICSKCKISKPEELMSKSAKCWCKRCKADYEIIRRKTDKYKKWNDNYQLQYWYNISIEDYNKMLLDQNDACAICKKPESAKVGETVCSLAVDHCHTTGKVRGLLCSRCNLGIGSFKDNITFFENAIIYLKSQI